MKLSSPIKISYKNLMAAKFRSFLTILGIIIGIASVIIVMAIGASAQQLIIAQVSGVGSNLVGVLPGASDEKGPPASVLGIVTTTLKQSDLDAVLLKKNVPNAVAASGYVSGIGTARYKNNSRQNNFQGVSADFIDVEKNDLSSGRFFTDEEDSGLARVAVLGSNTAKELFETEDPIGKMFSLKDVNFTVVGVLAPKGGSAVSNPDELVYMPLSTAQKILLGIDYLNFMRVKIDNPENITRAVADIKYTIRTQHRIKNPNDDDFSVRDTAQALNMVTNITNVLKYFLAGIAAISLLVGGVGIMNIMLISVTQRIREVGLRKAVGARNRHIITQFLIEAVFITLVGGIIGIIFGILISLLAAVIINALGYEWEFLISFSSIVVATMVSAAIGLLFGLYPARKAARISPMEALRYE
ncbi:MAG TPA: multidrug ABC transporter substrate-binding protein [Candidatus Moranbacteria bacterium]|nr:multidrug ABC transporter substrate-binding protein [Candidatus Moranbacteria bacterium]HBT45258.1 multidrug ABC transporter substrate-binding protein [Candidatus Moranbacteria bacterium]